MIGEKADILVTGAGGFIGRHLTGRLLSSGRAVCATSRTPDMMRETAGIRWQKVDEIGPDTDWSAALRGIQVVVHLAGRAHVLRDPASDPDAAFLRVNACGTERLAEAAASAGVRRFIYISSIKVNGEVTGARPFVETDPPRPQDAYGFSKLQAEMRLQRVGARTGMRWVIVRPPLVFGHDASGNFGRLLRAVHRETPMPFGALHNRRSLINVANLVDFLIVCSEHPRAVGEVFLVADQEPISTSNLVRRLASGMGKRARLISVPPGLLRLAGRIANKNEEVDRLCSSLQIDAAKARACLGWRARVPLAAGLEDTARRFLEDAGGRT